MVVIQSSEKVERVSFGISWIEKDNLVAAGPVVFLITVQEIARTEVWVDVADPVQEDIGTDEAIIDLIDVLHDFSVDILHELIAVGQVMQHLRDLVRHLLVLVEGVFQQGGVSSEGLVFHEVAKLLEDIEREDIHIVPGALDAFFDCGDLLASRRPLGSQWGTGPQGRIPPSPGTTPSSSVHRRNRPKLSQGPYPAPPA